MISKVSVGSNNPKALSATYFDDSGSEIIIAAGSPSHALLSATHTDVTTASVARGDIITGQGATPKWTRLALGTNGYFLKSNGTDIVWATHGLTYSDVGAAASSHSHAASDITSGSLVHERGGLEADVSAYNGLIKITGGSTSSVTDNSTNWDTAYGWGNHAGLYDAAGTAAGLVGAHESTYNHANYNTAYGWGNHAGLYDVTGTASGLIGTHESTYNHANYNTAYGWGNHALAGYLTSVTAHALLSATHTNTTTGTVVRGDVITGQGTGTPTWAKLAIGTSGKFLGSDGTDVSWITPDHDALTNFVAAKHYDWTNETHNIVTTGTISIGTNPATGGRIRIPNNSVISARNAADSANLNMIYADTGNRVIVGSLNSIICHPSGNMGVGSTATDIEAMSVYGRLALVETTAPSGTASYGKLYVKTSDHKLYYMNASGVEYYVAG
jgi:hypothetical protein